MNKQEEKGLGGKGLAEILFAEGFSPLEIQYICEVGKSQAYEWIAKFKESPTSLHKLKKRKSIKEDELLAGEANLFEFLCDARRRGQKNGNIRDLIYIINAIGFIRHQDDFFSVVRVVRLILDFIEYQYSVKKMSGADSLELNWESNSLKNLLLDFVRFQYNKTTFNFSHKDFCGIW